jgi:hypothetical protein
MHDYRHDRVHPRGPDPDVAYCAGSTPSKNRM